MSCDALEKMRANRPVDAAVILLAPGGTMVSESAFASMVLPPASMVSVGSAGRHDDHVLFRVVLRASSTAPGSTSETATAKLPPRVIQVLAFPSAICGGILWNSALVAWAWNGHGGVSPVARPLGRLKCLLLASDFARLSNYAGLTGRPASGFGYNFGETK